MNRRRRLLAVFLTLGVLVALSWYFFYRDRPAQEPALPEPKTTAELLVGKWRFVKRTPPLIAGFQRTIEYTKDGNVTMWTDNPHPRAGPRVESGVYRVEGKTLFCTLIGSVNNLERNVTIESITGDRLVTVYASPDSDSEERQITEYKRVREP